MTKKKLSAQEERELKAKIQQAKENARVIQSAIINGIEIKSIVYRTVEDRSFTISLLRSDDETPVAEAELHDTIEQATKNATAVFLKYMPTMMEMLRKGLEK